jgi:hypothetical protein
LIKDKTKRLGYLGDGQEVLAHPFFQEYDMDTIHNKAMTAPFIPELSEN